MERKMSACCGRMEEMDMHSHIHMHTPQTSCSIPQSKCSLAMAYVPWQKWEQLYEDEKALSVGTAFPSLDLPFCGRGVIE